MTATDHRQRASRLSVALAALVLTVCSVGVVVLALMGLPQILLIALALCAGVALVELAAMIATRLPPGPL